MNSLHFISHHLFVAAIGNDGRPHARPSKYERPSVAATAPASNIPLDVMDGRKLLQAGVVRPLRAYVAQAPS